MSEFIYKLNAMERAAQESKPAEHDYKGKREAVLEHVAIVEHTLTAALAREMVLREALQRCLSHFERIRDQQAEPRDSSMMAQARDALSATPGTVAVPDWEPIEKAPMYVYGRDALVGQYVKEWGWKKVSIWEREWTREDCIHRGATHWWPHLRDLPKPLSARPKDDNDQ